MSFKSESIAILKQERGLTLIEVVAAVVLLTIILTSFMQVFLMGVKTKVASEDNVIGVYAIQTEMEELIAAAETVGSEDDFRSFLTDGGGGYTEQSESPMTFVKPIEDLGEQFVLELKDTSSNHQQWGGTVKLAVLTKNKTGDNVIQQKFQTVLIW